MAFSSDLKIGVFRIFQEALKHVLAGGTVRELSLDAEVIDDTLYCHLTSASFKASSNRENEGLSLETSMRHRVQRMGGTLQWQKTAGANHIHLQIPFTPF